jgi:hypothetical protein
VVKDRTSSELSAEHIGEGQREVFVQSRFVARVCQTLCNDKLDIPSGVLTTVTGGIVTERADTRVAVVTSVAAIASARLGTLLVPHLVIGVVERVVLVGVNIVVVEAASMTTAAIGAASATATTALKTIKAFAFAGCVVASATARAFGVLVEVGAFGVQSLKGVLEIRLFDGVVVGRVCVE